MIRADGAQALAEGLKTSSVTELNLSDNLVGDTGATALAAALGQSSLRILNLGKNHIGAAGAHALAECLKDSQLTSLGLRNNDIGAKGGGALLEGLRDSPVIQVELLYCGVGGETLSQIQAVVKANEERFFILQMEVQKIENEIQMKFRTLAGSEAASLRWSLDRPAEELPQAVLGAMRSSGFQFPFKSLSAANLRFVCPNGARLDVGPGIHILGEHAPPLAQQLGLSTEPLEVTGATSSKRPQEGGNGTTAPSKRSRGS